MVSPENSSVFIAVSGRGGRVRARRVTKPRMIPETQGFTIIEVLVTLVILSLAMLGMARLQVLALRSDVESNARSQARILTGQLAEQLRSTREVEGGTQTPATITDPTDCDSAGTLQDYVSCFNHFATARLPGGTTDVTGNAADNTYTITASWTSPINDEDECTGTNRAWDTATSQCTTSFTQTIRIHPHGRGDD